jgi:hypothetical protein
MLLLRTGPAAAAGDLRTGDGELSVLDFLEAVRAEAQRADRPAQLYRVRMAGNPVASTR